jgi:hypothetical protein
MELGPLAQALYHFSHASSPLAFIFFCKSCDNFSQASLRQLSSYLFLLSSWKLQTLNGSLNLANI